MQIETGEDEFKLIIQRVQSSIQLIMKIVLKEKIYAKGALKFKFPDRLIQILLKLLESIKEVST